MSITGTIAVVLSTNKVTKTIRIFITVSLSKSTRRILSAAIFYPSIAQIRAAVVRLFKETALAVVLSASKAAFAESVTLAIALKNIMCD